MAETRPITLPFLYDFRANGRLEEAGSLEESTSPYFWLNSGAYLYIKDGAVGLGMTVQGSLANNNKWRLLYSKNNPGETDNGYHPQNIFRLLFRTTWQDIAQECYFNITAYNLSNSVSRSQSNGLLLFNRYMDENNLYYAGVRVDGYAVIKKKILGIYYTLAYKKIFDGRVYDREQVPNLLPQSTWIGVKTVVKNIDVAKVWIQLYIDLNRTGTWTLVAEVVDSNLLFGGLPLLLPGHTGIRTDFADVEFDNYRLSAPM